MARQALEVADVFRDNAARYKAIEKGHLSLGQLKVISAITRCRRPFARPKAVLAYLSRYTHRVAIANSRLTEFNDPHVSFTYKDYRMKGRMKPKTMQLDTLEFMRRFMLHVLPSGFHRIRHYGLLASRTKLALARHSP